MPSAFHIWPDVRIIAGIEASTMTSLGTCRLVMPRSESTIARAGPSARPFSTAARMASADAAGSSSSDESRLARPSLALMPASSRASPCSAKRAGRKVRSACPKMMGSETFIIVAFRCSENRTPSDRARSIWAARNATSASRRITVASNDLAGEERRRAVAAR